MTTQLAPLLVALGEAEKLLLKYGHQPQARIVSKLTESLQAEKPDYERLLSPDMWGGAGSVWEIALIPDGTKSEEDKRDRRAFRQAIINIAAEMDKLGIGNARSRSTAAIFGKWLAMFD